jgi:Tfp pilus assembly protein PilO
MRIGTRAPILAGVIMAIIAVLSFLLIVNPKRAEVADAQSQLAEAQSQELTKVAQRASLQQAEAEAPANRKIIRQVEQQLPPTADPQGLILLMKNAAVKSGVDLTQQAIGNPTAGENGVTVIPISVSLTGTYFSLDEYLFQMETLPRAAKVIGVSLAPGSSDATTVTGLLTMQVTIELYTTDLSAGPGSIPGPTEATA